MESKTRAKMLLCVLRMGFLTVGVSASLAFAGPTDSALNKSACYGNFLGTLTSWAPTYDWKPQMESETYETIFVSSIEPAGNFVWIGQDKKTKALEARKVTQGSIVKVDWRRSDCTPDVVLLPPPAKPPHDPVNRFNDQDLTQLLASSPQGVIVGYSDRMHLSLEAKRILEKIGKDLRIPILFLADPESPTLRDRKLASSELIARGMTLHYPSIIVYAKGKISSPMMPGFKSEQMYSSFIESYLK